MRSSEAAAPRVVGRVVALLIAVFAVACLVYPVMDPDSRAEGGTVFFPVLGVFLLACAFVIWLTKGTRPDGARRTTLGETGGEPALFVALRPAAPLVMLAMGTTGSALSLFTALVLGLADGGLLFLPVVLLFLAQVPDAVHALLRRPRLALTARGVELRGWSIDAELAWEDVTRVELEHPGLKWARIVVDGRLDAPSWQCRSHRLLLRLDRVPSRPQVTVLVSALDEPARVETLARDLARTDDQVRRELVSREGLAFLNRSM